MFINPKKGQKWKGDLEHFLSELKRIHGDDYDPKDVTRNHIQDIFSFVPLWCVKGNHEHNPTIDGVINKNLNALVYLIIYRGRVI